MNTPLDLTLEPLSGEPQHQRVARLAVRIGERDLWIEADGQRGLNLFAESQDGEALTPVLVLRPQAMNALGLGIALEAFEDDDHVHDADCGCGHDH